MSEGEAVAGRKTPYDVLRRDLIDVRQQFAAMNEVLIALGRDTRDPDAVLGTILESARRLCHAEVAGLYRAVGDTFALSKAVGLDAEVAEYLNAHPLTLDRKALIGRVGLARKTEQIVDVLADPDYGRLDLQRLAGFRTTIGSPLLLDEHVVGVLLLWRNRVQAFEEREMAVLETFSAQAAIALRTIDLVTALESRSAELARKVQQLQALVDVGEAVSSSLDLDKVLHTIVVNAVRMANADGGSIMQYVAQDRSFWVRTTHGTSQDLVAKLHDLRVTLDSTLVGQSARERRPLQVPNLDGVDLDPHLQLMYEAGWRSVLVAPMLRQGDIIGALVIRRERAGSFSDTTVDLLETFASQSALAIYNAGLFRELQTRTEQLQVASQHKSDFLASMSHELRTPLNAVIGFSEVLLERMFGDINDRQEEYLHDIWVSGRHLLDLLNEILDLSKVEAGQMELVPSNFDVANALEYVRSLVRDRAVAHRIAVDMTVDDSVGTIEADELRFKQVVLNLLSNAVKFTGSGGHVSIRAWNEDDDLLVSVTDTGPGIPRGDQERIFESFQQGGRGAPREEGTGLGLTLSRKIVGLFGGRLWLDSEVGSGSTFTFSVPVGRARAKGASIASSHDRPSVLVIEDDRASLELLYAYLEGSGIEVVEARDGQDGLERVSSLRPAAILLDIRLPSLDGWEFLEAVKANPAAAEIPVIVVSIVDERARGLALGAADYLMKPVRRDALLNALAKVGVPSARNESASVEAP